MQETESIQCSSACWFLKPALCDVIKGTVADKLGTLQTVAQVYLNSSIVYLRSSLSIKDKHKYKKWNLFINRGSYFSFSSPCALGSWWFVFFCLLAISPPPPPPHAPPSRLLCVVPRQGLKHYHNRMWAGITPRVLPLQCQSPGMFLSYQHILMLLLSLSSSGGPEGRGWRGKMGIRVVNWFFFLSFWWLFKSGSQSYSLTHESRCAL